MSAACSRKAFRKRGIRIVGWFALTFIAINCLWVLIVENWAPGIWDQNYTAKEQLVQRRVQAAGNRSLLLVLGSSRVQDGFRPSVFEEANGHSDAPLAFNFGIPGADPLRQLVCFRRLRAKGLKPHWVGIEIYGPLCTLPVSAHVIDPGLIVQARRDELPRYRRYSENPRHIDRTWWSAHLFPCYGFRLVPNRKWLIFPTLATALNSYDDGGWLRRVDSSGQSREARERGLARQRQEYAAYVSRTEVSTSFDLTLRELITTCRSEGAEPFLVRLPESTEFRAFYLPRLSDNIQAYLAKVCAEYELHLLDGTTWAEDHDLGDGVHLDESGANAFTRRFTTEFAARVLRKSPGESSAVP